MLGLILSMQVDLSQEVDTPQQVEPPLREEEPPLREDDDHDDYELLLRIAEWQSRVEPLVMASHAPPSLL